MEYEKEDMDEMIEREKKIVEIEYKNEEWDEGM